MNWWVINSVIWWFCDSVCWSSIKCVINKPVLWCSKYADMLVEWEKLAAVLSAVIKIKLLRMFENQLYKYTHTHTWWFYIWKLLMSYVQWFHISNRQVNMALRFSLWLLFNGLCLCMPCRFTLCFLLADKEKLGWQNGIHLIHRRKETRYFL